jgi:putative FmdB family regulatory protein
MPLYDYQCPACELAFEVSRTFAQADDPVSCPLCNTEAKRQVTAPQAVFSKGARAFTPGQPPPSGSAGRWSHHGHSHGPGTGSHTH